MNSNSNFSCFCKMIEAINSVKCDEFCDTGSIIVANGTQEIEIKTTCEPNEVWLRIVPGDVPVCNGNIDLVGYQLLAKGFVLYAIIQSASAEIFYAVK
jgi:hypothetical protein